VNFRWYIPVLVIVLAFFGISAEQAVVPNQEIVVQFDTSAVSSKEARQTISEITDQLKAIGVEHIQVSELLNGKLKVHYYSAVDVAIIKNLLNKQNKYQLGNAALNEKDGSPVIPFNSATNTYKLDVIIIQKNFDSNMGFQGLLVPVKSIKDQFVNQIVSLGVAETNFGLKQNFENIAYKNYRNASLLIDNSSYKIPEVRAGPLS
jgi:hypothetical protein